MSQRRSGEEQQEARRLAQRTYYRQDGLCFWCGQPMALLAAAYPIYPTTS